MKSYLIALFVALLAFAGCTQVQVQYEVPMCPEDITCPTGFECVEGICVERAPEASPYDWMEASTWFCSCEGADCIGTDLMPWECPLNVDCSSGACGVECSDHFWLSPEEMVIDAEASPPRLTINRGNGVVTCTQYVRMPACSVTPEIEPVMTWSDPSGRPAMMGLYFNKVGPDTDDCAPEVTSMNFTILGETTFTPSPVLYLDGVLATISPNGASTTPSEAWHSWDFRWSGILPTGDKVEAVLVCDNCDSLTSETEMTTYLVAWSYRPNQWTGPVTVETSFAVQQTLHILP